MWTAVPGCSQKSPLLLQCHLWFGALWQRPLSQALHVSWVWLAWNSTVPDGMPRGIREAGDETCISPPPLLYKHLQYCTNDRVKVLCSKHWDSISYKMTPLLHRMSLEYFYFILRCNSGKWDGRCVIKSLGKKRVKLIDMIICIAFNHWVIIWAGKTDHIFIALIFQLSNPSHFLTMSVSVVGEMVGLCHCLHTTTVNFLSYTLNIIYNLHL